MVSSTSLGAHQGRPEIPADLHDVAHRIHEEFDERIDPPDIDECLATVAAKFNDAKVRSFVPLLVRRYVTNELHTRLANPKT